MKTSTDKRTRWVGELVERADGRAVRQLFGDGRTIALPRSQGGAVAAAPSGSIVEVRGGADEANQPKLLAAADSALAQMYHIAARHQLDPVFPVAVERQVAALVAAPGLNDPELIDMRAHAFVTIDGPGTRDLDQALYVAREDGHLVVYYALADAAWCVTPGTPLFDEALRRGATYYLPGFSVPMLPRALSEGIVSLNEKVDRRALVFRMTLDKRGVCSHTELKRALIRSRGKLTFEQVDKHLHHPATQPFEAEVARCLQLFQQVGELRLEDAERRDVIHYRRTETEVTLDKLHGCRFVIVGGMRTMVERYNEQLSLLCNVEGAHYLRRGASHRAYVQPIYRVHPSPDPRRYAALEGMLHALSKRHHLNPKQWTWTRHDKRSLADFLETLPRAGELGRIAAAIHRQAVMANVRSTFSVEPGGHHGIGADVYARFSAPMREVVGVFLHKEAIERLRAKPLGREAQARDEALRDIIVTRANEAKSLQKRITKEANALVLDQLFGEDLTLPLDARPSRIGTVMGITPSKVHVQFDSPNIEVKVYTKHLSQRLHSEVRMSRDGAALHHDHGKPLCYLGDAVNVRLRERDQASKRWVLELV